MKLSTRVQNARLKAIETTVGAGPVLLILSGSAPANCAASQTGTVLASIQLPADWMSEPAGGSMAFIGPWTDLSADADGTAGHFRLKAADGQCDAQGNILQTGSLADMILDNVVMKAGQKFEILEFTIVDGNG